MLSSEQLALARLLLHELDSIDAALAGAGALMEHGLVDRDTEDLDMFAPPSSAGKIGAATRRIVTALGRGGSQVNEIHVDDSYARIEVDGIPVDIGVDWRKHPVVSTAAGPTLDVRDAIGNKVAAAFSRGEDRDVFDYGAILASGRWTEQELHDLARERDSGFDLQMLQRNIERYQRRLAAGATPVRPATTSARNSGSGPESEADLGSGRQSER